MGKHAARYRSLKRHEVIEAICDRSSREWRSDLLELFERGDFRTEKKYGLLMLYYRGLFIMDWPLSSVRPMEVSSCMRAMARLVKLVGFWR